MIEIDKNETIEKLKTMIEDKHGLTKESQLLQYSGKLLDDNKKLEDYNIKNNSLIFLSLNINGGNKDGFPDFGVMIILMFLYTAVTFGIYLFFDKIYHDLNRYYNHFCKLYDVQDELSTVQSRLRNFDYSTTKVRNISQKDKSVLKSTSRSQDQQERNALIGQLKVLYNNTIESLSGALDEAKKKGNKYKTDKVDKKLENILNKDLKNFENIGKKINNSSQKNITSTVEKFVSQINSTIGKTEEVTDSTGILNSKFMYNLSLISYSAIVALAITMGFFLLTCDKVGIELGLGALFTPFILVVFFGILDYLIYCDDYFKTDKSKEGFIGRILGKICGAFDKYSETIQSHRNIIMSSSFIIFGLYSLFMLIREQLNMWTYMAPVGILLAFLLYYLLFDKKLIQNNIVKFAIFIPLTAALIYLPYILAYIYNVYDFCGPKK